MRRPLLRSIRVLLLPWVVASGVFASATINAATLIVTTHVDEDDGDAQPGNGAGSSLRECVKYASAGDRVEFDASMSGRAIRLDLGVIVIDKSLILDGTTIPRFVTLTGDLNQDLQAQSTDTPVLGIQTPLATDIVDVRGLVITGGNFGWGSGISNFNGTLRLSDSLIMGNWNSYVPSFESVAALWSRGPIELERVTIAYNNCPGMSTGGTAILRNVTICNNQGWGYSSGAMNPQASPVVTMDHCTIYENDGGVQSLDRASFVINHTLCAGNTAGGKSNLSVAPTGSNNVTTDGVQLAALTYYHGPTPTRPPMPDSALIDAGATSATISTDQRGLPRLVGSAVDIGAVEVDPSLDYTTTVTTTEDGVRGSLRMSVGLAPEGGTVDFAGHLSGQVIRLWRGLPYSRSIIGSPFEQIEAGHRGSPIEVKRSATVDGSALLVPVTISGDADGDGIGDTRHFIVDAYSTPSSMLRLIRLNLEDGYASGPVFTDSHGGSILAVQGHQYLEGVVFRNNSASSSGGAIAVVDYPGTTTAVRCLFEGNRAGNAGGFWGVGGGAIYSAMVMNLHETAFVSNSSYFDGGAIRGMYVHTYNCLFSQNRSETGTGGAIRTTFIEASNTTVTRNAAAMRTGGAYASVGSFENCIVAGNLAPVDPDLLYQTLSGTGNFIGGNPLLAPLGDYGGSTSSMPPLPGSPVIDSGVATTLEFDQRGFSRVVGSAPDIGAVEYEAGHDYPLFWAVDSDGDGNAFGIEVALGTDMHVPDSSSNRNLKLGRQSGTGLPQLDFGFNAAAAPTTIWIIKRSANLAPGSFVEIYRYDGPTGTEIFNGTTSTVGGDSISVVDGNPVLDGRAFYLFEAEHVP